jgi:integrase
MTTRRGNDEGSIGKRKDGTYYGAIRIEGKRQWVYGETRKEVVNKINVLRQKVEQGIDLDSDKLTVKQFLERWLEDVVKQRNKPRTHESYMQMVNQHITPSIGTVQLAALRPDHIQSLLNTLAKSGKSPRTIQYARAIVRKALNQAIKWRYISFNAAAVVEGPRVDQHQAKPLTKEEARQFIDSLKGHRLEALYLVALLLGLRRGEALGLLIANLDLEGELVKVDGVLQWVGGKLVRGTTKTKAGTRTLPLPPSLIPALKAHLERQQAKYPQNTYVFASTTGTPINPRNLLRQFKDILQKAGLRDIRFHDLRHTAATFLIACGEHPRTIMDILGHSQISTTMNIYGHILDSTRSDAIYGLDTFLSDS